MSDDYSALTARAKWLRKEIFEMVVKQKKGHIPSSYSMIEILVTLYYGGVLRYDSNNPDSLDRDRLVISKGHAAMAVYPVLADLGYIEREELSKFTQKEGLLGMYADIRIPGVEAMSGSLGHGLGIASGFCYAAKRDRRDFNSYVILGDGECYEGSVWESALFAAHHRLDNLIAVVDRNSLCIMGKTEDLLGLEPMDEKWAAFGWHVQRINGHDIGQVKEALSVAAGVSGKPAVIIADTVKGMGISWMEGRPEWHNHMPTKEQIKQALIELESD